MTGNVADAEDVLQTLFLRLFRREFPPDLARSPRAYLYRAAVNIALDVIRSRKVHMGDHFEMDLLAAKADITSQGDEEMKARLRAALAELKPKAAEIFILRHVHGYTDAEIARLLGTSRGTIAVSLFRSRVRLRRLIRGPAGEDS